MSRPLANYEYVSFDDFEEMLADKPQNERWELIGGRVVRLMVGARWEHARIVGNIAFSLESSFRGCGSSCQTFTESFYMKERALVSQLLPDVMVVCGDLEPGATSTAEPVVLVEVLSVGSVGRDRYEKWHIYQQLPTLRHYVLVEQNRPHMEVYDRVDGTWAGFRVLDGMDAVLTLPALDVAIPLAEIYRRVL